MNNENKTKINWYPGHMAKTRRLISEKLDLIDVIFEVIDARIPYSSKIVDIDKIIKNKRKILIMTKIDLADEIETNKWKKYYEKLGYIVIGVDLINNKHINHIIDACKDILNDIKIKKAEKGINKNTLKVLIMGIPNVGKSTLINKLVGKKVTLVGNKPGVTKGLSWIRIDSFLELLDSPGILWPNLSNQTTAFNLAVMTSIKEEILPLEEVSIYILKHMIKYYPDNLKERYNIENIDDDIINILDEIGKRRGALLKGGEVDYKKVYQLVMKDLRDGYLGKVTFDHMEGELL